MKVVKKILTGIYFFPIALLVLIGIGIFLFCIGEMWRLTLKNFFSLVANDKNSRSDYALAGFIWLVVLGIIVKFM